MRHIIGLVGFAGSGKDALAKVLIEQHGWRRLAFADPLRESALALDPIIEGQMRLTELVYRVGWNEAKKHPEVRRTLQRLGTEAGRDIHGKDCWIKILRKRLDQDRESNFVFTDVRFPNEADTVSFFQGTLVYCERPGVEPVNNHISDSGIPLLRPLCWYTLQNDGTLAEWESKAQVLLDLISPKKLPAAEQV